MKRKKYKYPIYKKSKMSGYVVKFTGLQEGVVVKELPDRGYRVGYKTSIWVEHTNSMIWEDCDYKETK